MATKSHQRTLIRFAYQAHKARKRTQLNRIRRMWQRHYPDGPDLLTLVQAVAEIEAVKLS